jgi:DNA-binding MarR family transcriptional regulator
MVLLSVRSKEACGYVLAYHGAENATVALTTCFVHLVGLTGFTNRTKVSCPNYNAAVEAMTDEATDLSMNSPTNAIAETAAHLPNSDESAHLLLDVVPQVMQRIRAEMRRRRGPEISVLQLRALAFLRRNPGATLSQVAEHVGLTLPSMSSQVSGLVARKLIDRSVSAEDRRFVTLTLTEQGRSLLETARHGTQESLAQKLAKLTPEERATVVDAMHLLARVFAPTSTEAPPIDAPNEPTTT